MNPHRIGALLRRRVSCPTLESTILSDLADQQKSMMQGLLTVIVVSIIVDATDAPLTIRDGLSTTAMATSTSPVTREPLGEIYYIYEKAWSVCIDSLWSTCVGRCGEALTGAPYVCSCDSMCIAYHDCCMDFDLECAGDHYLTNSSIMHIFDDIGQFTCINLAQDWKYGVLMVSQCSPSWPADNETALWTRVVRSGCEGTSSDTFDPVESRTGLVFKNSYCAVCNHVNDTFPWTFQSSCFEAMPNVLNDTYNNLCNVDAEPEVVSCGSYRVCSYDINECPEVEENVQDAGGMLKMDRARLCTSYSKPVFGAKPFSPIYMYKNVHCAYCHGLDTWQLYCPGWKLIPTSRSADTSAMVLVFQSGTTVDKRAEIPDIPASFAILFYFGHDGSVNTLFSSASKDWWETTETKCQTTQLWDPFSETCRDIYCSSEFSFANFHCVHMYNITVENDDGQKIQDNVTTVIQAMDLSIVMLMMDMQLSCCLDDRAISIMDEQFIDALASALDITTDRFMNFTLYNYTSPNSTTDNSEGQSQCKNVGTSSVLLLDPDPQSTVPEPSVGKILATMSYSVALNQMLLRLDSGSMNIVIKGMHEKIVQYTNTSTDNSTETWCEDGQLLYYTNGEFTPILVSDTLTNVSAYLYINSTGITYAPGQFVANILFQGQQRSDLANVSSAAVVCERSNHNSTCLRIMLQQWEYLPLENGSIMYVGNNKTDLRVYDPSSYEILPNGDALVCISFPTPSNSSSGGGALSPSVVIDVEVQSWLTTIFLSFSAFVSLVTVVTYLSFAELRNPPGWIMINLTSCLLVYHIIYLSGMRPSVAQNDGACYAVAVLLHFFLLAFFFWMNVIAFDLYKTFAGGKMTAKAGHMRNVPKYASYAYGLPLAIVVTCVVLDVDGLPPDVHIDYGETACWIGNPLALAAAFAAPTLLVVVSNLCFYVLTVLSIQRIRKKVELSTGQRQTKEEFVVYVRIFTVMGFTWVFGYLSGIPDVSYAIHDVFAYLFIIFNALQGVAIGIAFVVNRKVLELYVNCRLVRFVIEHCPVGKCDDCKKFVCNCPKPIVRTISNETRQSIISNQDDRSSASDDGRTLDDSGG